MQKLNSKFSLYCTRFIYVALMAIPFAASFSSAVVTIVSIFMIVAFLLKRVMLKDFSFSKNPIKWPYLLIMFLALISFIKTISVRASIQGMWKLFYFGSIFTIIIEELKDKKHAKRIITGILLGLLLASLDGVWQLYTGWDFFRHHPYDVETRVGVFPRIRAAFPHTNIFAAYLGLFLPLSVTTFIYFWDKGFKRTVYLIISLLTAFCLFWTFSQGAAAGFIVALILIGIAKKNKFIFIFLVSVMILLPFIMPEGIEDLAKGACAGSIWDILLNPQRIGDFKNALNMIIHNPILGVGVNTYSLNIDKYKIRDNSKFIGDSGYSHNIYLHMAAEIGILGLFSFLWLIFRLFRYGIKKYRVMEDVFLKTSILGIIAGLTAFLINGLTETVLYYPKVAVLFWFQVGLLLGIIKISAKVT